MVWLFLKLFSIGFFKTVFNTKNMSIFMVTMPMIVGVGNWFMVEMKMANAQQDERQLELWKEHDKRADLILTNLSGTLLDLKSSVDKIDDRTEWLMRHEKSKENLKK